MTDLSEKVKDVAAQKQAGVAVERSDKVKTVFDVIRDNQPQFAMALGDNISPERFTRVALTVIRQNRQLAQCEHASLMGALMICAQLGLEPGGPLGQAYLIPFRRECTFIVGYKGYIALALRSGDIASVKATPVYDGDKFSWTLGLDETLTHEPTSTVRDDAAKLTHVYAIARFRDKVIEPIFVVLTRAEVDSFRARSRAKDNGPWVSDYVAMAQKTAVRRLATWLPMAVDVARASAVDERTVDRVHVDVDDFIDADGEEVEAHTAPAPDGSGSPPAGTASTDDPRETTEGAGASTDFDCDVCQGSGLEADGTTVCEACAGSGKAKPAAS